MMRTILETLDLIGRVSWEPVWIPVLFWTVFALPLWFGLERTKRLHPLAEYRLSQVLLATLPVGLLATMLGGLLPDTMSIASARPLSVTVLPAVGPPSVTTSASSPWQWTQALGLATVAAGIITIGSLGRLALEVVAAVHVRNTLEGASPPSLQTDAARLAQRLGTTRPLQVRLTPDASVPMTLGGLRPTILLPANLSDDPNALRMTLVHECIHIRRYDDLAHVLERFVTALFAVHPLVGRLQQQINEARERACDAAVLADNRHSSANYARLLLAFAEGRLQSFDALSLSESPSSLPNRLHAMQSSVSSWLSSPWSLGTTLLTVGLLLTLGVVACSDSGAPSSPEQSTAPGPPTKQETGGDVYSNVETPPKCGGVQALSEKIQYPELAQKAGIEGRVFVQFIVDKNGEVVAPTITKGVHASLNNASLAAVKSLNCEPGMKQGTPVKVQMTLPVTFKLPDDSTSDSSGANAKANTAAGLDEIIFHDLSNPQQDRIRSNPPTFSQETRASLNRDISYPELIRKAGIEGTVEITFTLSEAGTPIRPRVTNSLHDALDAMALRSVENTTFTTAETQSLDLSGKTISVQFAYRLPDRSS